ncbi:MAG: hypothetical protein JSS67_07620 [Bacteroidetes bacterium]|nr:hypothetical protein [Bacteroidota bacterium]
MFINERLLYLELHKTGCTHVLKTLQSIPDFGGRVIGKHNAIHDVPAEQLGNIQTKLKVGNIRNPWDWYVSLWAFGSLKKGGLYEQLTNKRLINKLKNPKLLFRPSAQWIAVYENAEKPELFRRWLKMVLQTNRKDLHEFRLIHENLELGLLTTRYLRLYNDAFHQNGKLINSYEGIVLYDKEHYLLDTILYNESLDHDLIQLLEKLNIDNHVIQEITNVPKTNTSKRTAYKDYYDEETIDLVSRMDKFIIEKHHYSF